MIIIDFKKLNEKEWLILKFKNQGTYGIKITFPMFCRDTRVHYSNMGQFHKILYVWELNIFRKITLFVFFLYVDNLK